MQLRGLSIHRECLKTTIYEPDTEDSMSNFGHHKDLILDQLARLVDNIVKNLQLSKYPPVAEMSLIMHNMLSLEALLNLKFTQVGLGLKEEIAAF